MRPLLVPATVGSRYGKGSVTASPPCTGAFGSRFRVGSVTASTPSTVGCWEQARRGIGNSVLSKYRLLLGAGPERDR